MRMRRLVCWDSRAEKIDERNGGDKGASVVLVIGRASSMSYRL
jgi:hypothetical protein